MQAVLNEVNEVPGVMGSMFCDAKGKILVHAFPPDHAESALEEAAAVLADSSVGLRNATGPTSMVDLRYADARLLMKPIGDCSLVLLCAKNVNLELLLVSASVAAKKLEAFTAKPDKVAPVSTSQAPSTGPTTQPSKPFPMKLVVAGAVAALLVVGLVVLLRPKSTGPLTTTAGTPGKPASTVTTASGPAKILLRLAGADALGQQLASALAEAYLTSLKATNVQTVTAKTDEFLVQGSRDGDLEAVYVSAHGTATAFQDLLSGNADLGLATRRIRPEERQRLAALGSMTSQANEHVLALDGIAVIVNPANPVAQFKREQLATIYSGGASDWSSFGVTGDAETEWAAVGAAGYGTGGPLASGLHVYAPDDKTGLVDIFQSMVLGKKNIAPEVKRVPSFQAVREAVVANAGAIGFVPSSLAQGARVVPVADLDDPPMIPTPFTVATEEYLLTHRIYLYAGQASTNPNVSRFVEFALGPQGQAVVKDAGFVELAIKAEQRSIPAGAPPEYIQLTRGAKKLSSTFRFESNSSAFDNRALRDLDRVVRYLNDKEISAAVVRIMGFADAQGSKPHNVQLSLERANLVAQALAQRGVSGATVAGLGSALPVADNATEEGRQRNRRVEIWVTR